MKNAIQKINELLAAWITIVSTQKHIQAIKLGIIASMPFCIACGILLSTALLLHDVVPFVDITTIWMLYQIFLLYIYIFIAYEIGKQLSISYQIESTMLGMLAALSSGIICMNYAINTSDLTNGLLMSFFPMLLLSLLSTELFRLAKTCKLNIKNIPTSVIEYINNLIPLLVCMIAILCLVSLPQDWFVFINEVFVFFTQCFDSIIGVLLIVCLTCMFWIFGIHGVAIIGAIVRPFWMYMLFANSLAYMQGITMPYCSGEGFFQWFIWIGGSGTTIGLVLWMKFAAKSKHLRAIGKDTIISSLFNINEPVVFGTPMAMNPYMMFPFLVVPMLAGVVNYFLIQENVMNAPFLLMGWVFPAPLGALLASGGDVRLLLGIVMTLFISIVIYAPFFFIYDRKLKREEER